MHTLTEISTILGVELKDTDALVKTLVFTGRTTRLFLAFVDGEWAASFCGKGYQFGKNIYVRKRKDRCQAIIEAAYCLLTEKEIPENYTFEVHTTNVFYTTADGKTEEEAKAFAKEFTRSVINGEVGVNRVVTRTYYKKDSNTGWSEAKE